MTKLSRFYLNNVPEEAALRERGFYWVHYYEKWTMAYWDGDNWLMFGSNVRMSDRNFLGIDEERIKLPNETTKHYHYNMFIFPDYFHEGKLPREIYMNTTRVTLSEAKIVADCLMVAAIAMVAPYQMPKGYKNVLQEAADWLGMTTSEPILPPTAEGFYQYAKRSGLINE